jgi:hypothetical protein
MYPIRLRRDPFRGQSPAGKRKKARYDEDVSRIEEFVNSEVRRRGPGEHQIAYDTVAFALNLEFNRVATVLGGVAGGHTALRITVPEAADGEMGPR